MTFSQHAARHSSAILFYRVLWAITLPMFYWFMMNSFYDKLQLGFLFQLLLSGASLGMIGAAAVPETTGWRVPIHRYAAYGMAYLMCPIVFVITVQGKVNSGARIVLWGIALWMLSGVIRSLIEKRTHGDRTLLYQATYIALFHIAILTAYYV